MKRRLAGTLLALPLAIALALAGCGGPDGDDSDIASANSNAADQSDTDDGDGGEDEELTEEEVYEAMLAYAECMREHGVEMEDPEPGEGLRLQMQGDPEETEAAREACQPLLPEGGPGGANAEEAQENMLAFAECMRDNGVENFPDPQPGGGLQIQPDLGLDPDDPTFQAAQETCQEQFGMRGGPRRSSEDGDA